MAWRRLVLALGLCLGCGDDDDGPADADASADARRLDSPGESADHQAASSDVSTEAAASAEAPGAELESATDGTADLAEAPADAPAEGTHSDGGAGDAPADRPAPSIGNRKADILFVIDNSGSMAEEQSNLVRNFPIFMDELGNVAEIDVRIGVVSTDLGAGAATSTTACLVAPGDDGALCKPRAVDRCAACGVQGSYLTTMAPNFVGNIRDTFACVARLGTSGCGYEHSLGALRRALTSPQNGGFVRPDALLAFVIITDEDDCTAPADSQLFASERPGQDLSLRCALEGHLCQGRHLDGTVDVDLALGDCQAATDGALVPVQQLVDAVLALKTNPAQIIATGIFGWPLPAMETTARYRIQATAPGGARTMTPVCSSPANGTATPGYRVKRFVESFPNSSTFSICENDFREALRNIGEKIRNTAGP